MTRGSEDGEKESRDDGENMGRYGKLGESTGG